MEQTNNKKWMEQELSENTNLDLEMLPSMVFARDDLTDFEILPDDLEKPFQKWDGDGISKKIVPVVHNGEKKNWWINIKNPILYELYKRLLKGETHFRILCTGERENTRYKFKD